MHELGDISDNYRTVVCPEVEQRGEECGCVQCSGRMTVHVDYFAKWPMFLAQTQAHLQRHSTPAKGYMHTVCNVCAWPLQVSLPVSDIPRQVNNEVNLYAWLSIIERFARHVEPCHREAYTYKKRWSALCYILCHTYWSKSTKRRMPLVTGEPPNLCTQHS